MGYEKHAFARDNVMPLLPVRELPLEGPDALTRFYASKVKCRECAVQPGTAAPVESLNQHRVQSPARHQELDTHRSFPYLQDGGGHEGGVAVATWCSAWGQSREPLGEVCPLPRGGHVVH